MNRTKKAAVAATAVAAATMAAFAAPSVAGGATPDHPSHEIAVRGQKPVQYASGAAGAQSLLASRGGAVMTGTPRVFVDFWGSTWGSYSTSSGGVVTFSSTGDPSQIAPYLQSFLSGVGTTSDTWSTSTTQYCSGVQPGTTSCPSGAAMVGWPGGSALVGVWAHTNVRAPNHPTQGQLAAEAQAAAQHYVNSGGTNVGQVQFVVATAHNHNMSGFGVQWCAWHSSTSSTLTPNGLLSYTNLPYMTDAGASCGANFVSGPLDGVSIVEGHEYAETLTDPYPNGGWLDPSGAENGDKCAWISSGQGAAGPLNLGTGTFPVQSLFSNSFSNGAGGCVISYSNNGTTQS